MNGRTDLQSLGAGVFWLFAGVVIQGIHIAPGAGPNSPPNASTSANYCLLPADNSSGGGRIQSGGGAIMVDAMLGDAILQGVPGQTVSGYSQVPGFTGQTVDIVSIEVNSTPATVSEGFTRQLVATATMDDTTTTNLDETGVTWNVIGGPVTGIDANGLATADFVFEDTLATVEGDFQTFNDPYALTVQNSDPDNFGAYGSDGIDDDWQVNFFGLPPNADAAPGVDFDVDDQDNLFEFIAGVDPTDPFSRFKVRMEEMPGPVTEMHVIFDPRFVDRNYTVVVSTDFGLSDPWVPLIGGIVSDNGMERTVTDTNAVEPRKFYQVEIEKP